MYLLPLWLTIFIHCKRKTQHLSAWWNLLLLMSYWNSNLSHRTCFHCPLLFIALETLSMWVCPHLKCPHQHRSWGWAHSAGVVHILYWTQASCVYTGMPVATGVLQHLRWMEHWTSAPKSCQTVPISWPTIGSPLFHPSNQKLKNSDVSLGQPVCTCDRGGRNWEV